jgi:hypothetical protein
MLSGSDTKQPRPHTITGKFTRRDPSSDRPRPHVDACGRVDDGLEFSATVLVGWVHGSKSFLEARDPDLHWQLTSPAHVKGVAVKVSQTMRTGTRATVWVTPVIVVWGEFAQVVGGDTCKFVLGDSVARWLKDQPARIAPGRVEQIAEAVASTLPGLDVTRRWSRSVRRQS